MDSGARALCNVSIADRACHIPVAASRNSPVICAVCGKRTERRMRGQRYCSKRCRQRASREKLAAGELKASLRYPYSGDATTPLKSSNEINSLPRQKTGSSLYANAPLNILGGGSYQWLDTPRLDARTVENVRRSEIGAAPSTGKDP
jgi:hypothetical protein